MITLHRRTISTAVVALALGAGIAGCSSDEGGTAPGVDPAVVGTWTASSFATGGNDLIAMGMTMVFNFNSDGTYSFNFTNDQGGFCTPGPNCTDSGVYTASATQIVLDPGTIDEATLDYSIAGTVMTVNAVIDGNSITAVFDKL